VLKLKGIGRNTDKGGRLVCIGEEDVETHVMALFRTYKLENEIFK
jgi:hypothetical protein